MGKDVVFCMTVITERQLFSGCDRREGEMNVFLIFLSFDGVATGTIHIDEALAKVEVGIGVYMAVHTRQLASLVDVLCPPLRIDI